MTLPTCQYCNHGLTVIEVQNVHALLKCMKCQQNAGWMLINTYSQRYLSDVRLSDSDVDADVDADTERVKSVVV